MNAPDKVNRKIRFRVTVADAADGNPSPHYASYLAARGHAAAAAEN